MQIAARSLILRTGDALVEIPIRIFVPQLESDGRGWQCRYEIDWPHKQRLSAGHGVDAVQALQLTMQKIGTELYASDYHKSGKLYFDQPGAGYGFPVPKSARNLLIGEDAKFDG